MGRKCIQNIDRRDYWSHKMDEAYDFMKRIDEYPVEECGESLASLESATSKENITVKFSKKKAADGSPRLFYLREGLVGDFLAVAREMNECGWILKVEDGFRTVRMQAELAVSPTILDGILQTVLWECGGELPDSEFIFRRLSALVASCPKNGTHMSGSAIDVTVLDCLDEKEIERGGDYLELSEITPMESPFISPEARKNRHKISFIMQKHGFLAYPYEFWHYSQGDSYEELLNKTNQPTRYGPIEWDPKSGSVSPVSKPVHRLNSLEQIKCKIDEALQRLSTEQLKFPS